MLLFFPFALFIRFLSFSKALAKILKRKRGCKKILPNSVNQVICAFLTKPSLRSIPANDVREKFLYIFFANSYYIDYRFFSKVSNFSLTP